MFLLVMADGSLVVTSAIRECNAVEIAETVTKLGVVRVESKAVATTPGISAP
jgi:hypothetical protein